MSSQFNSGLEGLDSRAGNFMRISELASRSGVPRSTIHYYLRQGLLHAPLKTGRTMAYYDSTHLERLKAIRRLLAEKGLPRPSLKVIRERLADSGAGGEISFSPSRQELCDGLKLQRREKVLSAALRIFSDKGFQNTSVKDITTAAGISTGTFYIHYRDKQELFEDVLERMYAEFQDTVRSAEEKESDSIKKMMIRANHFFEFIERFGPFLEQVRMARAGKEHFRTKEIRAIYEQLLLPIADGIARDSSTGIIRKVDPELTAYAVLGIMMSLAIRRSFDRKYFAQDILTYLADLFLHGISPQAGKPEPPKFKPRAA